MLEDADGEIGVAVDKVVPFLAHQSSVEVYRTREWASGIRLYVTGHEDGTLGLWRSTRLPPGSVAPGRIMMVEFHGVLLEGTKDQAPCAVTAIRQKEVDIPVFYVGFSDGSSRCLEFEVPTVTPQDEKGKADTKRK
ncbi:hypothetical protein STCU_12103 [Strigomonas culicis]|uniref:Uncharacterized protein n=1 Tax=Strigomonas culicis TaxID=28005 RepID=S9UXR3_9TRYP|nr:hypothetical protein STCU_12103 [Strigomonas culicis]|eukprot:EPY15340.1 hypothetical protein STCU_12103 [Strigomonas culicis]